MKTLGHKTVSIYYLKVQSYIIIKVQICFGVERGTWEFLSIWLPYSQLPNIREAISQTQGKVQENHKDAHCSIFEQGQTQQLQLPDIFFPRLFYLTTITPILFIHGSMTFSITCSQEHFKKKILSILLKWIICICSDNCLFSFLLRNLLVLIF